MNALRTPDERFAELPEYPFMPHYAEIADGLRVHYLDEGPPEAAPVLMLHGEPSWSFLYRRMVPIVAAAGHRCVVPDLVGFGRSDKPTEPSDYSYERHVAWMRELLFDHLDLRDVTLFGQDWGGLIGLRLLAEHEDRFSRAIASNTFLPTGDGKPSDAFLSWQRFARETPDLPIGGIIAGGCVGPLAPDVVAAYDAPYPDPSYKAGARQFPVLVPTSTDDPARAANLAAWKVLERFDKPFLCAFSDGDPITKGGDRGFIARVPGAAGQPHTTIEGGGHFLQEEKGEVLAQVIVDFIARG
jgi:haloalkane dehalogenase